MIFTETRLEGAYLIDLERLEDERGYFARSWCEREFLAHGLDPKLVQCNVSFNKKKGTLRGMHYQLPPFAETKLVRCTRGALYDVIIDLRSNSSTFLQWIAVELTPENNRMLHIPKGFAHGFQTMEDNTEVFYQMSEFYSAEHARGLRWNDPLLKIIWPDDRRTISVKDREYPDLNPAQLMNSMVNL
jgi:dTDP-4-dehydrorhamnose 3,5-epimerase